MHDLGRVEILAPFLLFGTMAAIAAYMPRAWPLGVLAGVGVLVIITTGIA